MKSKILRRVLKFIFLFGVFIFGIFIFSHLLNDQETESASDQAGPTLPVICADIGGNKINQMYGYVNEMDTDTIRIGLIPITTARQITIAYKSYGNRVKSISYEITTPDTGVVVENAKIGDFRSSGEYETATFKLTEPILMDREYPIKFTLNIGGRNIYYYSRVIQRSGQLADTYVQFVYDFYETCTNKAGASELNQYLETDETVSNNSFANVNLKSSFDQVTWGRLNPQIYRKGVPTIREISGATCSITMEYMLSGVGDDGIEIYHVYEFYRMRYFNGRIMLLNFNRKALQVYDPETTSGVNTDGVELGISTRDIQYVTNDSSDTVAFVQDNSLWSYGNGAQKVSLVFSFHSTADTSDERSDINDYGIKIIRVSESGDIDFTVYGYMSGGMHEGQVGISICHFSSEAAIVDEKAFIPVNQSYEFLSKDLEKLNFVTSNGVYYCYLNETVYRVNLAEGKTDVVLSGIDPDCFVSSDDQEYIAWMDEMEPHSSSHITVMKLTDGLTREVESREGQYLTAVGFINDDFIYGIVNASDIYTYPAGNILFPVKELKIESFDGTLVKDYNPEGVWISDISMTKGLIALERVVREGDVYVTAAADTIMNNKQESGSKVTVNLSSESRRGTVVTLKFPVTISNLSPLIANFKIKNSHGGEDIVINEEEEAADGKDGGQGTAAKEQKFYYVYALGSLYDVVTSPGEAILKADENVGVVLNDEGQYIYERGNKQTENEIQNEDIPEAILSGMINAGRLQEAVPENVTVMNLSGCTLSQVLYEVSLGRAVVTRLADGSTTVIVGYNNYNTRLYNFETGEHYWMGINDSTASFLAGGNVFVSYYEPQATIKG